MAQRKIIIPCGLDGDDVGIEVQEAANILLFTFSDDMMGGFIDRDGARQLIAFLQNFLRNETAGELREYDEDWNGAY